MCCRIQAAAFLLTPVCQRRGAVAKSHVPRKFTLPCRNQLITVLHIMYIPKGKPATLHERRQNHFSIKTHAFNVRQCFRQDLGFQRPMTSQCRIPSADQYIFPFCFSSRFRYPPGNIPMHRFCLCRCKTAGVGQNIADRRTVPKAFQNRFLRPVRVNRNTVYGLGTSGVII